MRIHFEFSISARLASREVRIQKMKLSPADGHSATGCRQLMELGLGEISCSMRSNCQAQPCS